MSKDFELAVYIGPADGRELNDYFFVEDQIYSNIGQSDYSGMGTYEGATRDLGWCLETLEEAVAMKNKIDAMQLTDVRASIRERVTF